MGQVVSLAAFAPPSGWRFSTELHKFFGGYEATVGLRSTFGAMVNALNGVGGTSGSDGGGDGQLAAVLDSAGAGVGRRAYSRDKNPIARGRDVWQALRRTQDLYGASHVVVLHLLYGDPSPAFCGLAVCPRCAKEGDHTAGCDLTELAPILHLTDYAEELRDDMALAWGEERESSVRLRLVKAPTAAEERFWALTPYLTAALERQAAAKARKAPREERAALAAEVRELRGQLYEAMGETTKPTQEPLPAVLSTLAGTDREITPRDALRRLFASQKHPDDTALAVSRMVNDARMLRTNAHLAYEAARSQPA